MLKHVRLIRRAVGWVLGVLPIGFVMAMGAKVLSNELAALHPPRGALHSPIEEVGVTRLVEVSIPRQSGGKLGGWYAASRNGASVILTHGTMGDRSDLSSEIRILANAGYGVLAFDWPGHGLSDGEVEWGRAERLALREAIDWLATQPGVDQARIGVYGFSLGGYVVAQVAASDPRLKVVALAGTPSDVTEQVRWEYRHWGRLSQWPALWLQPLLGYERDDRKARDMVPLIAPRRVLIITGDRDPIVQPIMAEELYRAARHPKGMIVVRGAAHGDYAIVSPGDFPAKLIAFFSALKPDDPTKEDSP